MMQSAVSTISISIILTVSLAVSLSAAVLAQQAVVPGRSAGTITLGMPRAAVWKHLGKPTEIHFLHVAEWSYTWDYWQSENSGKREMVTSRQGRVVQIERDVIYTEAQIDHGDWRSDTFLMVHRQHSHLNVHLYIEHEDNGSTIVADDTHQGIAWVIYIHHYNHNAFNTHLLSEIGPDKVIIHWPGTKFLANPNEILDERDPSLADIRAWFAASPVTHKGD